MLISDIMRKNKLKVKIIGALFLCYTLATAETSSTNIRCAKKSNEYIQCDDKLYYIRTDKLNNSINEDPMRYVDVKNGIKISDKTSIVGHYIKDESKWYYNGREIKTLDIDKAISLGDGFIKDNERIYFKDEAVENIDMNSFREITSKYYADKSFLYYVYNDRYYKVNIQLSKLTILNENYYKDDEKVMYRDEVIEGADPSSFKVISKFIGYDNNNIYAEEVKYDKAANKDTLKELSDRLSYDDKNLYRDGDIIYKFEKTPKNIKIYDEYRLIQIGKEYFNLFGKIQIIKNNKFVKIGDKMWKSKDSVYSTFYDGAIRENFDWVTEKTSPRNFKNIGYNYYCNDKNIYWYNNKISEKTNYKVLSKNFIKIGDDIYFKERKVINPDIESFEVISDNYSKDKNYYYFENFKLEGRLSNLEIEMLKLNINNLYLINKR